VRMLLAIDAGNTNVAFAVFEESDRKAHWRIRTRPERTADEFGALLANLFKADGISFDEIDGCVLSSVVPPATPDLIRLSRHYFKVEPLLIGPDLDLGIEVRYRPAGDVGADRLVDAAMALERYGPAPLIFVDLGTGTTFNAISAPNLYLGGAICPGLGIAWDAMFERAARLYRVECATPPSVLADNTLHALQSGMVFGAVSMIDGMVRRIQTEMGAPGCQVIATGGNLSPAICEISETINHVDPLLTLDGLALVYGRNRPRSSV
jgi:type III pantothenate kinase